MLIKTTNARFQATPDTVFNFLSQVENLPKWATAYCQSVRRDGEQFKIQTAMGELLQFFDCNPAARTIDMTSGPTQAQLWTWYVRVTSDNGDGCVVSFTSLQMPGQPDAQFHNQCEMLAVEFEQLRHCVTARPEPA